MSAERVTTFSDTHFEHRTVCRSAGGDEYVVDRCGRRIEELSERFGVVGVECRSALRADVGRSRLEPLGITPGQNDVGAFEAGTAGGFESDTGASTEEDDGLPGELWLVWCGDGGGSAVHGFSDRYRGRYEWHRGRASLASHRCRADMACWPPVPGDKRSGWLVDKLESAVTGEGFVVVEHRRQQLRSGMPEEGMSGNQRVAREQDCF